MGNVDIKDLSFLENKISTKDMIEIKEEPNHGIEFSFSTSAHDEESETLKLEMKQDISKLFHEFDMMCLYDYDQTRVGKVQDLFERYFKEQTSLSIKLLEGQLKHKTNELITLKEEFEKSRLANSELHQRIQEFENQKLLAENCILKKKTCPKCRRSGKAGNL